MRRVLLLVMLQVISEQVLLSSVHEHRWLHVPRLLRFILLLLLLHHRFRVLQLLLVMIRGHSPKVHQHPRSEVIMALLLLLQHTQSGVVVVVQRMMEGVEDGGGSASDESGR